MRAQQTLLERRKKRERQQLLQVISVCGMCPADAPEPRRWGGSSRHSRSTDPSHSSLMVALSTVRELQRLPVPLHVCDKNM